MKGMILKTTEGGGVKRAWTRCRFLDCSEGRAVTRVSGFHRDFTGMSDP